MGESEQPSRSNHHLQVLQKGNQIRRRETDLSAKNQIGGRRGEVDLQRRWRNEGGQILNAAKRRNEGGNGEIRTTAEGRELI
jgi:hypothetical protein